jgi:hypothetical protein
MNNTRRLKDYSQKERNELALKLVQELIRDQRMRLHYWRDLTNQPAQIDTGYVAQHLVSVLTGIEGERMRGKGQDLSDGSEIKSANFLDSLDKKGAVSPRWNFTSNDMTLILSYLEVPAIYLVSLDFNPLNRIRIRIWKIDPDKHTVFRTRYKEWIEKLAKPKLQDPRRPAINFQLFPPRNKTNENYARHGNDRENGFPCLKIYLENVEGAEKIFHAEENTDGKINLITNQ